MPVQALTLPPDTESPRRARRFVEESLPPDPPAPALDVLRLLVSEVVTNAVLHARSEVVVRVGCDGGKVRVEVRDTSTTRPRPQDPGEDASTGRGLFLVDQLADAWGTVRSGDGKVVWFEVVAAA